MVVQILKWKCKANIAANATFEERLVPNFCPICVKNGKKLIIFKNFTLVSQSQSHKIDNNTVSVFPDYNAF